MNGEPIAYCQNIPAGDEDELTCTTDHHAFMDKRFEELGITCPSCQRDSAVGDDDDVGGDDDDFADVDTSDGLIRGREEDDDRVFDLPIFVRVSVL